MYVCMYERVSFLVYHNYYWYSNLTIYLSRKEI